MSCSDDVTHVHRPGVDQRVEFDKGQRWITPRCAICGDEMSRRRA